ncbi:MAG: hypothetical protein ACREXG_00935 [Polaromonas sp.]
MPLITVPVRFAACDPDGRPAAGDIFRAQLDKTDIDNAAGCYVVPALVEVIADASGTVVLNLWPNELGTASSRYRFEAFDPNQRKKYIDIVVSVPNRPCNLHEIAAAPNL